MDKELSKKLEEIITLLQEANSSLKKIAQNTKQIQTDSSYVGPGDEDD